jgi:hypothetical protein
MLTLANGLYFSCSSPVTNTSATTNAAIVAHAGLRLESADGRFSGPHESDAGADERGTQGTAHSSDHPLCAADDEWRGLVLDVWQLTLAEQLSMSLAGESPDHFGVHGDFWVWVRLLTGPKERGNSATVAVGNRSILGMSLVISYRVDATGFHGGLDWPL